jgi:hypothetical protein
LQKFHNIASQTRAGQGTLNQKLFRRLKKLVVLGQPKGRKCLQDPLSMEKKTQG